MKSRALLQPTQQAPHISSISVLSNAVQNQEQKIEPRSRLSDSYNFLMGLINAEPSDMGNPIKKWKSSNSKLNFTYGDLYKENFVVGS